MLSRLDDSRKASSREAVEATVSDYLEMLGAELSGMIYGKTKHRRRLAERLQDR